VTSSLEIAKTAILAVGVPLAVFSGNWIYRSHKGYSQTAAADFLLGVFIFDICVVLASGDFEPFLRSEELRPVIAYWTFAIGSVSGLAWSGIIRWGEPRLAQYHEHQQSRFPIYTFLGCWMAVLASVALHIAFFMIKLGGDHA
jgi:hypothetical protein